MRYLTDEERQLASRFLFLSMAVVVIQQDKQHIQKGKFKIKEPYLNLLEEMNTEAIHERRELRRKLRNRHLQIVTLTQNDSFSTYLFICEGREEKQNYFNPAIRKKVQSVIQELMGKAQPPYQHYTAANI